MRLAPVVLSACCALFGPASFAQSDTYPAKPIRIIVATPPGSTPDVGGRLVAARLSAELKQPVVIENRPGVNGLLAAREVLRSAHDGYTLLLAPSSTMAVSPHVYPKQAGSLPADFLAVSQIYRTDFSLIVSAKSGLKTVSDVIAAAKRQPGRLVGAFASVGSASHVSLELFKQMAGVDIYVVPFNGSPAAALGVAAGDADILFETVPSTEPVVSSGKARRIAMTGAERFALTPSIPTVGESGLPGYVVTTWAGIFAPKGVPADRIQRISAAIDNVFQDPAVVQQLAASSFLPGEPSAARFQALWQSDSEVWRKVVATSPELQQEKE